MNELMTELLNELINQLMNSEHLCMYATELYDTVLLCYKPAINVVSRTTLLNCAEIDMTYYGFNK